MILILAYRALRRANLLALQIGTTLILDAKGARIQFAAAAMKGRRSYGVRIDPLRPLIDEYLRDWRPRLGVPPEEPMFWAARRGAPLSASAWSTRIGDQIKKRLGVRISPHFFRDRLATTLVEDRPTDGAALGTVMLAHRDGGVTDRYYRAYAESLAAQGAVELVLGGYAMALTNSGGTALPICRKAGFIVPWNRNPSGNDCRRAASRTLITRACAPS